MWLYSQTSGQLWDDRGHKIEVGYSGHGEGKNNPKFEAIKSVGPIPKGDYTLGDPYDSKSVGPYAIPLSPHRHNCYGRTHFRIHGDSSKHPGEASEGCIILPRKTREFIMIENDRFLRVIE